MHLLMHGGEIRVWREEERYKITAVQAENLKRLDGLNVRLRELHGMKKRRDGMIDRSVLRCSVIVEGWKIVGLLKGYAEVSVLLTTGVD